MLEHSTPKLRHLKNIDIFRKMRHDEHELIERYAQTQEVKKGESLYCQGLEDEKFYMLKKGAVKIVRMLPQGRELILDIINAGAIFGEMLAVNNRERDESAIMVEDGLVCNIRKSDFRRLQEIVPGLSLELSRTIGMRLRRREDKLIDLICCTVEQRLAKTIVALLEDFGAQHEKGYALRIKLSHKDFADLIASTRETVTATLSRLKRTGILGVQGGHILVPSVMKLRALADETKTSS